MNFEKTFEDLFLKNFLDRKKAFLSADLYQLHISSVYLFLLNQLENNSSNNSNVFFNYSLLSILRKQNGKNF